MEKQATLALFDFDGTIIPGDSIVRYTRWARKKGAMSWGKFLKACLAAIGYPLRLVSSERSKTIRIIRGPCKGRRRLQLPVPDG